MERVLDLVLAAERRRPMKRTRCIEVTVACSEERHPVDVVPACRELRVCLELDRFELLDGSVEALRTDHGLCPLDSIGRTRRGALFQLARRSLLAWLDGGDPRL